MCFLWCVVVLTLSRGGLQGVPVSTLRTLFKSFLRSPAIFLTFLHLRQFWAMECFKGFHKTYELLLSYKKIFGSVLSFSLRSPADFLVFLRSLSLKKSFLHLRSWLGSPLSGCILGFSPLSGHKKCSFQVSGKP